MTKYNNTILEIWRKQNISPLSPLLMPDSIKMNETLAVGLNPSNSYESIRSVKNQFEKEWLRDLIIRKIDSPKTYNEFLSFKYFKKNQNSIWKIQEWCHASHRHFIKQNKFLLGVGINQFRFIDLFPIWSSSQDDIIKYLKNNKSIKSQLLDCFIDMIDENNIKKLIFLNKESYNQFKQYTSSNLSINIIKSIDVGKVRMKNVEMSIFYLGTRKVNIYCVGIGGWDNNEILIKKLNKEKFFS